MRFRNLMIKASIVLAVLITGFIVYSFVPRVGKNSVFYGEDLKRSHLLSDEFVKEIRTFIEDTATNSQVVIGMIDEEILFEYGKTDKLINCHSVRKSIISLLFGIARDHGILELDEILGDLEIDESNTPLTKQEKSATIRDLLTARSGVYLAAEAEVDYAKNNRPSREQYKPGEYFFYNNFDFNVLGAILEKKTGMSLGKFMEKNLARPLEMQDFSSENVVYGNPWPVPGDTVSDYEAYWMFLSGRDLARIGTMVAQNGKWNGRQVVSSGWIEESVKPYIDLAEYDLVRQPVNAFGYLWWLDTGNNIIWADGYGGQFMLIDPGRNIVLVQRNFTGNSLLTSGMFLMRENRDNSDKTDLFQIYKNIVKYIDKEKV